jgi:alcohol dehydrogenase (cytochrome c)
MKRNYLLALASITLIPGLALLARQPFGGLSSVTTKMLENPSPNDWLMYNRTYDSQRYSPLKQITKANVGQPKLAWSKTQAAGTQETIPLVHDGIMYIQAPGAVIQALDAANGTLL